MKKTLAFLLILSSIIGFSQTKPTDPGFKSLITPRAVTFWWDAANSDPWMQSSYLGTAPNTWVKLWTATKTKVKLDSLANAKQDTLMLTTTGTGAATLIGSTLNIPIASGIVPDSLKEDKANKENTTVDNNTTKYPTVNLLKTYADTKAPLFTGTIGFIPTFTGINSIGNSIATNETFGIGITKASGDTYFKATSGTGTGLFGTDTNAAFISSNLNLMWYAENNINNFYQPVRVSNLASTNPRLLSSSSTGQLTPVTDGIGVLKSNGSGSISYINDSQQSLSGTNVTWNLANGKDATITLTGNTVITLTNATQGLSGTLWVTNPSTVYTITFAGYVNDIDPFIELASNVVITYAGYRGDYTFKYNGSQMKWNGCPNRKHL